MWINYFVSGENCTRMPQSQYAIQNTRQLTLLHPPHHSLALSCLYNLHPVLWFCVAKLRVRNNRPSTVAAYFITSFILSCYYRLPHRKKEKERTRQCIYVFLLWVSYKTWKTSFHGYQSIIFLKLKSSVWRKPNQPTTKATTSSRNSKLIWDKHL